MFVEIKTILPKKSYTSEKIIIEEIYNNLRVYYLNYYPTKKLKSELFQPKEAIVPKELKINSQLIKSMGLYFGDGQKSIKSKSYQAVRFANSDPTILRKFIESLELLNVCRSTLKVYIRASNLILESNESLRNFWSKYLNIPNKNIYKINRLKNKYVFSVFAKKGTPTIIYANSSFRLFFDAIYEYIKNLAKIDTYVAANFIKGVIAADGCVHYNGRYREVSIAAKKEEDRNYLHELFLLLNIFPNKDNTTPGKEQLTITGYSNLKKIEKYSLCSLYPKKAKKFDQLINSYKNICYRKGVGKMKVLSTLGTKKRSVSEIAITLNRKENAIRRYLYFLEKEKKVKRVNKKRTSNIGRYSELWQKI